MPNNRLRIVIADDEQVIRSFFQTTLERMGHDVVAAAHDGETLVAACAQYSPDLVITDLKMPGKDGLRAAEEFNQEQTIPVIVVSAFNEPDLIHLTTAPNICSHLVKPVTADELQKAVEAAMRKTEVSEVCV